MSEDQRSGTLCETSTELEADDLLDVLAENGLHGEKVVSEADGDSRRSWVVLVAGSDLEAARGILQGVRQERRRGRPFPESCPRCGYALEGLAGADLCPECGESLSDFRLRKVGILTDAATEFQAHFLVDALRGAGVGAYCAPASFTTLYGMGRWNVLVRLAEMNAAQEVLSAAGPEGARVGKRALPPGLESRALAGALAIFGFLTVGLVLTTLQGGTAWLAMAAGAVVAGAILIWAASAWIRGRRKERGDGLPGGGDGAKGP